MKPLCVHCGYPYGVRKTTTVQEAWPQGSNKPVYHGPLIVIREQVLTSPTDGRVISRDLWDGETWEASHRPFCTARCALDFARKAHAQGIRARRSVPRRKIEPQAI